MSLGGSYCNFFLDWTQKPWIFVFMATNDKQTFKFCIPTFILVLPFEEKEKLFLNFHNTQLPFSREWLNAKLLKAQMLLFFVSENQLTKKLFFHLFCLLPCDIYHSTSMKLSTETLFYTVFMFWYFPIQVCDTSPELVWSCLTLGSYIHFQFELIGPLYNICTRIFVCFDNYISANAFSSLSQVYFTCHLWRECLSVSNPFTNLLKIYPLFSEVVGFLKRHFTQECKSFITKFLVLDELLLLK